METACRSTYLRMLTHPLKHDFLPKNWYISCKKPYWNKPMIKTRNGTNQLIMPVVKLRIFKIHWKGISASIKICHQKAISKKLILLWHKQPNRTNNLRTIKQLFIIVHNKVNKLLIIIYHKIVIMPILNKKWLSCIR